MISSLSFLRKRMPTVILLGAAYLAGLVFLLAVEDRVVFFPDRKIQDTPRSYGLAYEDVRVTTSDGVSIHGWWIPAAAPRFSLLFMHGNAGNIGDRADNACRLAKLGINVLLFDYRGFGESQGTPSERGAYLDSTAMLAHLRVRAGVDRSRILYFGRSLGAAVAMELAVREPPRALVMESAFCSIKEMAWDLFPYSLWAPFIPRHYDTLTRCRGLKAPVLFIHGKSDEIIGFRHGERLFEAAQQPKWFFDKGGTHNDFYGTDRAAYFAEWEQFLARIEGIKH